VRLKLDENLGRSWADRVRRSGHDVDTVGDEGLAGASESDVLAAAVRANRALVTMDLDFANPLRFPPGLTAGIVVLRVGDRPGRAELDAVVNRLGLALEGSDPRGHLWVVEASRVRQYEPSAGDDPSAGEP
jgi:predicted nuclease of predicted toxin-antitoxin system